MLESRVCEDLCCLERRHGALGNGDSSEDARGLINGSLAWRESSKGRRREAREEQEDRQKLSTKISVLESCRLD